MLRRYSGQRFVCMVILGVVLLASTGHAAIVALKRDAGLTSDGAIDARLDGATVVTTAVKDTSLSNNPNDNGRRRWMNYGAAVAPIGHFNLHRFDLSSIPAGSTIALAQLRLYHASGTTQYGPGRIAPILTHDWLEGTVSYFDGGWPGTAGGASLAHPMGYNTYLNQNADGSSATPWQSWGVTSDQFFSMTGDAGTQSDPLSGTESAAGYHVYDVTADVQAWVNGSLSNHGWAVIRGNWAFHMSEAGTQYQPVLFIDYAPVPEPASLALLLGGLGLWRVRRPGCQRLTHMSWAMPAACNCRMAHRNSADRA